MCQLISYFPESLSGSACLNQRQSASNKLLTHCWRSHQMRCSTFVGAVVMEILGLQVMKLARNELILIEIPTINYPLTWPHCSNASSKEK